MSQAALTRIERALRPLDAPPIDAPWNHHELDDLMPPALREAAVLVGLVERSAGTQVVFTRRTDHLRHHAGQVSFPGGAVEPDDRDVVAAALRETHEEIGVDAASIQPLGFLDPMATITGFRVVPVVARIDAGYHAIPDPAEVAEVFELPLDFILAPDSLFHAEVPWRGRVRRIAELRPWQGGASARVWGATAIIIDNLRQRLEGLP